MWVMSALFSALFTGTTWVLSKGAKRTDVRSAIALRSLVLFGCVSITRLLFRSQEMFSGVDIFALRGAVGAGVTAAIAAVCYQKSLEGGLGRAAALEKLSILLIAWGEWRFFGVKWSTGGWLSLGVIAIGVYYMVSQKTMAIDKQEPRKTKGWIFWIVGTVVFSSVSALLSKLSVGQVSPDLALVVRTGVAVLSIILWMSIRGKAHMLVKIEPSERWILVAAGVSSALAWSCYYRALSGGSAGVVHSLDKLSVLVTSFAGWLFYGERHTIRTIMGILIFVFGVLLWTFLQ